MDGWGGWVGWVSEGGGVGVWVLYSVFGLLAACVEWRGGLDVRGCVRVWVGGLGCRVAICIDSVVFGMDEWIDSGVCGMG